MNLLLTDLQIEAVGHYQLGLSKLHSMIKRLNAHANEHGLDIRPLPDYPLALSLSDSQNLVAAHCREVDAINARAAEKRLERLAA
jgi:hypothetical protein